MPDYGMVIDLTKCNGCYNCFLACKDEHWGNDYPPYFSAQPYTGHFWLRIIERERGTYPKVKVAYTPLLCMHCANPSCIKSSQDGSVYQRPDGIIIVDPEKAVGQREIMNTCPYQVIYWNEEKNIPQKCTFCAHLLDRGEKVPRCVEACPTGALIFGDIQDPNSDVSKLIKAGKVETLLPEYKMGQKVHYIGLPKRFIAGEIIFADKQDKCAENVKVTLIGQGMEQLTTTNNFGDFEFEGLGEDQEFTVRIQHPGYALKVIDTRTKTDIYLGEIILDPN